MLAIGLIDAAHKLGLDVPGDVSITGYDDIEVSAFLDPPLTTIRNPKRELGELAVEYLLVSDSAAVQRKLTGSLVVRDSTAVPAGNPPPRRAPTVDGARKAGRPPAGGSRQRK